MWSLSSHLLSSYIIPFFAICIGSYVKRAWCLGAIKFTKEIKLAINKKPRLGLKTVINFGNVMKLHWIEGACKHVLRVFQPPYFVISNFSEYFLNAEVYPTSVCVLSSLVAWAPAGIFLLLFIRYWHLMNTVNTNGKIFTEIKLPL